MNYLNALPASLVTVFNLADRVAAPVAAAADRAITVWSWLTQPQAIATYRWLGAMTVAIGQLIFWSAVWVYTQAQRWAREEVNMFLPSAEVYLATTEELFAQADAIARLTDVELAAEFNDSWELPGMVEASDFDSPDYRIPAQAQSMAAPYVSCSIPLAETFEGGIDREELLNNMTLAQLRPIAEKLKLPTRKVKKANLIADILKAEGAEV